MPVLRKIQICHVVPIAIFVFLLNIHAKGIDFNHDAVIVSGRSNNPVSVFYAPPTAITTSFYGHSNKLITNDSSVVNIFPGGNLCINFEMYNLKLYDSSTINVYSGSDFYGRSGGCLNLCDSNVLNVNGGKTDSFLSAGNYSTVNINYIYIFDLDIYNNGTLNLHKGAINKFLNHDIIPSTTPVNLYSWGF